MTATWSPARAAADATDAVVVGIDIGTTYSKAVAVRADGSILAEARSEHEVITPRPGWFEHDPEGVWWGDTRALCRRVVRDLGTQAPIRAIAVTTCGPCIVPLDGDGHPLRAGILYGVDTRATEVARDLEAAIGRRAIRRLSGMDLTSQSVGPKIAWVWRHEPEVAAATATWHTATSFVVARLTGVSVIDHHQASYFTPFIDVRRKRWDLRYTAGLPLEGRLPQLAWPGDVAGPLTVEAAAATGLPAGIPVLVGTSDGPTEALAVGATWPGVAAATYGTTTTITTFAAPIGRSGGLWVTEGLDAGRPCVSAGLSASGAIVSWLRRELARELPQADVAEVLAADRSLDAEAASSPVGARGLLALPYLGGQRTPIADPDASGVLVGLTLQHTRADVHRAILEGIGYAVRHIFEAFDAAGVGIDVIRAAGGGTASALALQTVSDITGREQVVARPTVGASYGAALLAARAIGVVDPDSPDGWFTDGVRVRPDPTLAAFHARRYAQFRRLYRDTRPVVHALATDEAGSIGPDGGRP